MRLIICMRNCSQDTLESAFPCPSQFSTAITVIKLLLLLVVFGSKVFHVDADAFPISTVSGRKHEHWKVIDYFRQIIIYRVVFH